MSFKSLDLPDYLLQAVEKLSYKKPTPIQEQAIPLIIDGQDLVAEAQTGTGKTAAFALPTIKMINELPPKKKKISVLAVVLVPTRELALQVSAAFKAYAQFSPKEIKLTSLIGGEDIKGQIRSLRHGVDIAVATPGRLLELIEQKEIRLFEMQMLILDEADKMLDLGFNDELNQLFDKLPKKRQNLLFSATLPQKVVKLTEALLDNPTRISTNREQQSVEKIQQKAILVDRIKRRQLLQYLITTEKWSHAMIFVSSKRAARNITNKLQRDGIAAAAFHGDLKQDERIKVLKRFKNKEIRILVATDIAARGIDINKLSHVVNYDLPRSPLDYIHRIGRTGRAGQSGVAISFIGREDEQHFKLIEKRAGIRLEWEQVEGFERSAEAPIMAVSKVPAKGKGKKKNKKRREEG